MYVFKVLEEIRERTDMWIQDCNGELLHNAPGNQMPSSTDGFAISKLSYLRGAYNQRQEFLSSFSSAYKAILFFIFVGA